MVAIRLTKVGIAIATGSAAFLLGHKTVRARTVDVKEVKPAIDVKNIGKLRVAIIGAGVGGSSCSYFLTQLNQQQENPIVLTIDIFEEHEIGGRAHLIDLNGHKFEAGGSILHPDNRYMANFVKLLGLTRRDSNESSNELLGLWDGKNFVFEGSRWSFLMDLKLIWHFGYDCVRYKRFIDDTLKKFNKIYSLQEDHHQAFTNVPDLLRAMSPDFEENLTVPIVSHLKKIGCSDIFIDQLANAITICNYGQDLKQLHTFVGAVSLAGGQGNLWSVRGGNCLVPQGLVKLSEAVLYRERVEMIEYDDRSSTYTLRSQQGAIQHGPYDSVVIAHPLVSNSSKSHITFKGVEVNPEHYGPYHRTVTTFVQGEADPTFWNRKTTENLPDCMLSCNSSLWYKSMAKWVSVNMQESACEATSQLDLAPTVWKMFSERILERSDMVNLFTTINGVSVTDWLAYPEYSPDTYHTCRGQFVLGPHLYYINAIEWAASAMEMSAIGGHNVALLIYNHFVKQL